MQKTLSEKLEIIRGRIRDKRFKIMIIGLGSVGLYLLDYLLSDKDEDIEVVVCGRDEAKMSSDVNIIRVSSLIRGKNKNQVTIDGGLDLNDISSIETIISKHDPDIIVNSSRAYAHIKYGAISWNNLRAYGIWTPLAIKFTKNIMEAYGRAKSDAVVINTSYPDASIPWLKSAGKYYPDLGSGNVNHLIPRVKMAVANLLDVEDFWNVDVTFPTAHFHDGVISKEGHNEGVDQRLTVRYKGEVKNLAEEDIFKLCAIPMPTDAKRNMMNASSNYEIIRGIVRAARDGEKVKLHCPGAFGEIGGYPVIFDGSSSPCEAYIDETDFPLDFMRQQNRNSLYLDGVEDVREGSLIYTDELLKKVDRAFGVHLPKEVPFEKIDETATYIIENIIEKFRS